MRIGVPKEIKQFEYRVSISPNGVKELVTHGHTLLVETGAGHDIGFEDAQYHAAGATIVSSSQEIFKQAELVVKVKEPQLQECELLQKHQMIFSYLHLAANKAVTDALLASKCIAIAYETVTDAEGTLPLLAPMSEVAGSIAVQAGAACLERPKGGRGVLLGGVPGVPRGKVVVIGGGVVGTQSAMIASGMGADVTILERSLPRIRHLAHLFGNRVEILFSTTEAIEQAVLSADLLIGAVLIPGAAAPKLVNETLVTRMKRRSVIVDVAIDQGGCIATSKPTTHGDPTFIQHDVVHYCVSNMPSAVARTATKALEHATLPYILRLADHGYKKAFQDDPYFMEGLNLYAGKVTHPAIAQVFGHSCSNPRKVLGIK